METWFKMWKLFLDGSFLSNTLLGKPASREKSMEPLITHVPVEKIIRGQEALSFVAAVPKPGALPSPSPGQPVVSAAEG